jgi:hypothetical protein
MAVLWVVAPCSLVEVYQRFRGPCCPHHQEDPEDPKRWQSSTRLHGATTQKTAIFVLTAVRTSNSFYSVLGKLKKKWQFSTKTNKCAQGNVRAVCFIPHPKLVCVKHFEHCCPYVLVPGCHGVRGQSFFTRDDKRAKGSIEPFCLQIRTRTRITPSVLFLSKKEQELRST